MTGAVAWGRIDAHCVWTSETFESDLWRAGEKASMGSGIAVC